MFCFTASLIDLIVTLYGGLGRSRLFATGVGLNDVKCETFVVLKDESLVAFVVNYEIMLLNLLSYSLTKVWHVTIQKVRQPKLLVELKVLNLK